MADLTNDQRLVLLLTPLLAQLQQSSVDSHNNAEAFRTNGKLSSAHVHATLEQRGDEQVDRLADLMEALAAGTVRIVDEAAMVRTIAQAFDEVATQDFESSSTHHAQIVLERLRTFGAIR